MADEAFQRYFHIIGHPAFSVKSFS